MKIGILGILALLFSPALTSNLYAQENIPVIRPTRITAKAILNGTQDGIPIQGEARIVETQMGLRIMIQFEQAPPGPHGIHIHEKGSCDDSGKAAGGHFNPDETEHGFWPKDGPEKSHSGDMGNVMISKAGKGP